MIERFNFYDVYGNLLPGIAFLALLWLPFGLTRQLWPSTAFSSAILALAFAYFLGHILQSFASNVFPSKAKDSKGKRRYPSSLFLDPEHRTFAQTFKVQLAKEVERAFHLHLEVNTYGGDKDDIDRQRRTAFFLCRGLLVREKLSSYGEQFEGLYALMRGLATSFWLATPYFLGWAASVWHNHCFCELTLYGVFGGLALATISTGVLVFADPRPEHVFILDIITFLALVLLFFCLGVVFGISQTLVPRQAILLAAIALGALLGGGRFFRAYKYYAEQFARAIWQDFAGHRMLSPSGDPATH